MIGITFTASSGLGDQPAAEAWFPPLTLNPAIPFGEPNPIQHISGNHPPRIRMCNNRFKHRDAIPTRSSRNPLTKRLQSW